MWCGAVVCFVTQCFVMRSVVGSKRMGNPKPNGKTETTQIMDGMAGWLAASLPRDRHGMGQRGSRCRARVQSVEFRVTFCTVFLGWLGCTCSCVRCDAGRMPLPCVLVSPAAEHDSSPSIRPSLRRLLLPAVCQRGLCAWTGLPLPLARCRSRRLDRGAPS